MGVVGPVARCCGALQTEKRTYRCAAFLNAALKYCLSASRMLYSLDAETTFSIRRW